MQLLFLEEKLIDKINLGNTKKGTFYLQRAI